VGSALSAKSKWTSWKSRVRETVTVLETARKIWLEGGIDGLSMGCGDS
jgi:hypothetical protein